MIFELGARHLTVGFDPDSAPRCTLRFGPEESRRVGDYRRWLPGYGDRPKKKKPGYAWGEDHELWRMDLGILDREPLDLGLVEDKIERAVREAHSKYLLSDSKSRKSFLILPSVIPHPLLSSILSIFFSAFPSPSITLFSTPVLCTVASGCRTGLVVDIGWNETIVTAIYEYCEVCEQRTTRGMKLLTLKMAELMYHYSNEGGKTPLRSNDPENTSESLLGTYFEQSEEATMRMAWCRTRQESHRLLEPPEELPQNLNHLPTIAEDIPNKKDSDTIILKDPVVSVPSPLHPRHKLEIPFSKFADPVEEALLAHNRKPRDLDDHETPLHLLIYRALLALPADVRAICMSRIIITGGGSNIAGLKSRLLEEVTSLVNERGWDPIHGKAADERRKRLQEICSNRRSPPSDPDLPNTSVEDRPSETSKPKCAGLEPQEPDDIEDKIRHEERKGYKPIVSGVIRGVETLGPWAGGSLAAGLKIKGVVEVERDSFMQYGLAGARKDSEMNTMAQRQSFGPNANKAGIGEKSGWTLGAWA